MDKDTQLPVEVAPRKYNTQNLLNANEAKKNTHQTFLDRITEAESGCWEWQGSKDARGYGKISINGTYWRTNRYSYQYYKGEIGRLNVLHKCDNPACCNPEHLFIGNQSENAIDMLNKGRSRVAKTTPEQVFKIRDLFTSGLKRKEIAAICGVSRRVVEAILNNESWTHLTNSPIKHIAVNAKEYASLQERLQQAEQEIVQLKRWKMEAAELLTPINAYVHKHIEASLGQCSVKLVLERCKQFEQAEKVIYRHEGGLLPDRLLYNEIKTFLDGK